MVLRETSLVPVDVFEALERKQVASGPEDASGDADPNSDLAQHHHTGRRSSAANLEAYHVDAGRNFGA